MRGHACIFACAFVFCECTCSWRTHKRTHVHSSYLRLRVRVRLRRCQLCVKRLKFHVLVHVAGQVRGWVFFCFSEFLLGLSSCYLQGFAFGISGKSNRRTYLSQFEQQTNNIARALTCDVHGPQLKTARGYLRKNQYQISRLGRSCVEAVYEPFSKLRFLGGNGYIYGLEMV